MRSLKLFLFTLLTPIFLFAQIEEPAVQYHIENEFDTLNLPTLQWILQEGEQPLSNENLLEGNTADAKLIDLKNNPVFSIKAHTNYWFNIKISSEVTSDFGLVLHRNGDCYPYEITFKDVKTFSKNSFGINKIGISGNGTPASKRDFSNLIVPSAVKGQISKNDTLEIWCKILSAERCDVQIETELVDKRSIKLVPLMMMPTRGYLLFRGACVAMLLLALLLFIWSKEKVYLWFMLFQFSLLIYGDTRENYNEVFNTFLSETPRVYNFILAFLGANMITSLLHFGRVFINTKEKFPIIHRIITYAIIGLYLAVAFGTALRFIPNMPGREFWFIFRSIFLGSIFASLIGATIYLLFSKDTFAQLFSIGALLPFTSIFYGWYEVHILKIPYERNISLIINAGIVLTMTLALAYRFRMVMMQREDAQKEKMNAELANAEQSIRMKINSKFFSNITHEFLTPLTLILEPVRQILKEDPNSKYFEKLNLVKNNSEKLLSLVNQLLDVSKAELNLSLGNVSETIRPVLKSYRELADRKGIKLKMSVDESLSSFYFDKNKIEQVVYNLLSNAIKFTESGKVELAIESDENAQFIIRVSDTGVGISDKELPFIFERFHQGEAGESYSESTGVGLALVKELTEVMNGNVSVKSELNTGSAFEIKLPIIRKINAPANQATTADFLKKENQPKAKTEIKNPQKDEEKPIILLVEDNDELRTFVKQSLEADYQVIEANDGVEGIKQAKKFIPDLIVSDVMMPEKDGFELTDEVKQDELTSHIPIILLTGKTASEARIAGLRTGADAYLTKPFNTEELMIRIEKLIEIRRALQQKFSHQISFEKPVNVVEKLTESQATIDLEFIKKVNLIINEKIEDTGLKGEIIAKELFMSRSQFFRKLKALTGQSPTEFIRNFRLDRAKDLLKNKKGNVFQVSGQVGFGNEKYFSTRFKERFGVSPSEI